MITSAQNPLVKRYRSLLRHKKTRVAEKAGVIEGIRPVLTTLEHAPEHIEALLIAPDLLSSPAAWEKLSEIEVRSEYLSIPLFNALSERQNPTGLAAIVRSPAVPLAQITPSGPALFVLLEHLSDPGNLGTIIRSADAAGAAGIILLDTGVDITHPTALKAAMGTAFVMPIGEAGELSQFQDWISTHDAYCVAMSANAERTVWETEWPLDRPLVVMMGNEQHGLSPAAQAVANIGIRLPMLGEASSLNVATATSIFLYECLRRQWSGRQ